MCHGKPRRDSRFLRIALRFAPRLQRKAFATRSPAIASRSECEARSKAIRRGVIYFLCVYMTLTPFFNQCFDKRRLKQMIVWSLAYQGSANTLRMLEKLKVLGFQYATYAGISLGIDDLRIPPKKRDELRAADVFMQLATQGEYRGERTAIEGLQGVIETWNRTSENVKDHVVDYFKATDTLNPVYMMSFSGARGNISQVRQLVGMRGLMSDAQGTIIGFPIRSNFREGLTLTEYIISCYGARKGVVDTALRTADAGYLTRRLVDVAQHIVVRTGSCGTRKGVVVRPLYEYGKELISMRERLVGRVLAADITHRGKCIARRNEPISPAMADVLSTLTSRIASRSTTSKRARSRSDSRRESLRERPLLVRVRSPLTCALRHGICKLCYGWSLASQTMVSLGEAVGVMAGQSIGEPGTQLTMRTFHTGGVFTGAVEAEFRSPHAGYVTYPKPFRGCLVRTPSGRVGFLIRRTGFLVLTHPRGVQTRLQVPRNTALFVREGEYIGSNELLGLCDSLTLRTNERRPTTKIVFSNSDGQVLKLGHGRDISDEPQLDQLNIERLEERLLRPPGWTNLTPTGATIRPPGKKRRIPRKKKGGTPRYPFQGARSIPWNSALTPASIWVLAGTRLGPSHAVLNLYASSGHLVEAGLPYRRMALVGHEDIYICRAPSSIRGYRGAKSDHREANRKEQSALLLPPTTFSRMSPAPTIRPMRTFASRIASRSATMGYTPCLLATCTSVRLYQDMLVLHTCDNDVFVANRPGLPRRDDFWRKALAERRSVHASLLAHREAKHSRSEPSNAEASSARNARSLGDKFRRPLLSRASVTTPSLPSPGTRVLYLPAAFRTEMGGFFWSRPELLHRHVSAGFLFFTPYLYFQNTGVQLRWRLRGAIHGVGTKHRTEVSLMATAPRVSRIASLRIAISDPKQSELAPTRRVASWVRTHDPLFTSSTLQGCTLTTRAPTYGLVQCSVRSEAKRHVSLRVPSAFRINPCSLDTTRESRGPQPQRVSTSVFNFPFPVCLTPDVTIRSAVFHAGWAYLPPLSAFRAHATVRGAAPQCAFGFMQPSQPVLLNGMHPPLVFQAANSAIASRRDPCTSVRTQALTSQVHHVLALRSDSRTRGPVLGPHRASLRDPNRFTKRSVAISELPRLRALLSFRHSDFMRSVPERTAIYRVVQGVSVFTHALSPWFALVQPGCVAVRARPTVDSQSDSRSEALVYSLGETLGLLYVASRSDSRSDSRAFAPVSHVTRTLQQVQFRTLLAHTLVYLCTQPQMFSLQRLEAVQHTLLRAQAFDSVVVVTPVWSTYPPLWTKQLRTGLRDHRASLRGSHSDAISDSLDRKVRLALAPLGVVLRKAAYALRVAVKFCTAKALPVTFPSPVRPVTMSGLHYWSLGSQYAPGGEARSLFDMFPGQPTALRMASDPTHVRVVTLPLGGETCRMGDRPDDAVVLMRPQDLATYPIPTDRPCRTHIGALVRYGDELFDGYAIPMTGQVVSLTTTHIVIRRAQVALHYEDTSVRVQDQQWISSGTPLLSLTYQRLVTGDIVQGIPKIEQLFEASKGEKAEVRLQRMAEVIWNQLRRRVHPQHAVRRSLMLMQREIIDRIQRIYLSQGVVISDKHMEVIVRRMTSWVRVMQPGTTGLFIGEVLSLHRMDAIHLSTRPPKAATVAFTVVPDAAADRFQHAMRWTPSRIAYREAKHSDYREAKQRTLLFRGPRPRTRLTGRVFRHPKVYYHAYTGYDGRVFKYRPFHGTPFSKKLGTTWFTQTTKLEHIVTSELLSVTAKYKRAPKLRASLRDPVRYVNIGTPPLRYAKMVYRKLKAMHRPYLPEYLMYAPERLVTQENFLATCQPYIRGISAVALDNESFLSAASFQETTRVLTRDSLFAKKDFLRGLKECVIVGDLIPAGTGLSPMIVYRLPADTLLERDQGTSLVSP